MNLEIRTILYASGLDEGCEAALTYAINLANRMGARLLVLTVIDEQRERSLIDLDSHVPQQGLDQYHDDRAARARAHIEAQATHINKLAEQLAELDELRHEVERLRGGAGGGGAGVVVSGAGVAGAGRRW